MVFQAEGPVWAKAQRGDSRSEWLLFKPQGEHGEVRGARSQRVLEVGPTSWDSSLKQGQSHESVVSRGRGWGEGCGKTTLGKSQRTGLGSSCWLGNRGEGNDGGEQVVADAQMTLISPASHPG